MPPTNTTNLPFIPVTIHQMQQNVITKKTYNGYKYNIWALLMHGYSNRNEGWLTTHARRSISSILSQVERTQGASQKGKVKWDGLYIMLSEAKESPIIHIDRFTPEIYMTFLQGQRNLDGSFLKPSNYTGRSSSLRHLFRCHPDLEGYPPGFEERLKTLKTGFLRTVVTARAEAGDAVDDGKKPMTSELYRVLCKWFFEEGTSNKGLF